MRIYLVYFHLLFGFYVLPLNECKGANGEIFIKSIGGDTNKVNQDLILAKEMESTNTKKSFELGREALRLSQDLKFPLGEAKSLNEIGRCYKLVGSFDSALMYFRKSLATAKRINDLRMIASTFLNMGTVFKSQGVYDSATIYYHLALGIAENTKDLEMQGSCLNNLGNILKDQNDIDEALNYYLLALPIREQQENKRGIANSSLNIGICYDLQGNHKKAETYFINALQNYTSSNDKSGIAKADNNIAQSLQTQGRLEEAMHYLTQAMNLQKELGDKDGIASTIYSLALLKQSLKQYEEAYKLSSESLPIAEDIGNNQLVLDNYELLQKLSIEQNDFRQAYEYSAKASRLRDSIFNENKTKIIEDLQTKYETEKKEQQIKFLDEANKNKDLQQNFLMVGTITLLIILFATLFIYAQRQRIAKQKSFIKDQKIQQLLKDQEISTYNAMIEGQEDERKRIAVDLHDRLGSMLSTVRAYFTALKSNIDSEGRLNIELHTKATSLLDTTFDELRKIANNLSTGLITSVGLYPALEELCETIERGSNIKCKVFMYNFSERIDNQTEIAIYRIIQELLSNILKHAESRNATIQLNRIDETLQVTLEEDGIGYDFKEKMKSPGMGLKNILARTEKLKGKFFVDSEPGKGSVAFLEIPLHIDNLKPIG